MGLDLYVKRRYRRNNKGTIETCGSEELAYFRKVNCLIPHFEKWLETDIENCEDYPITKDSCLALIENCKEVLEHHEKASELMPVCEGFFFGSNAYDKYYFEDLNNIIDEFESNVIPEFDNIDYELDDIVFHIWY